MLHPYQCLLCCKRADEPQKALIVAASGPFIHTFSACDGKLMSTWPRQNSTENFNQKPEIGKDGSVMDSTTAVNVTVAERLPKRRKVSTSRDDSSSSTEIIVEEGSNNVENSLMKQPPSSPIVNLACTSSGKNVVAVTGEDKCIRVFELTASGRMNQLSERYMPKRPCAIALTRNDSTILCADKFGDVYSLPLLFDRSPAKADAEQDPTSNANGASQSSFTPSATSLTVHTKRNREALRQQQKLTNVKAEKKSLNFEHHLLLGHVSLLTDVACVSVPSSSPQPREYILTSDRDEHIRVSRGIHQAHIIEGYCLGHTEFVSKLCFPRAHPRLMVSGGGDDYLLRWDWLSGTISQKVDIKNHVHSFKQQYYTNATSARDPADIRDPATKDEINVTQIAITNILALETRAQTLIAVTCEGVPAIFMFLMNSDAELTFQTSISLEYNVIDMVFVPQIDSVVYSMDTVHQPFSTTVGSSNEEQGLRRSVGALQATDVGWEINTGTTKFLVESMENAVTSQPTSSEETTVERRSLKELLYNLENLRKRGSEGES